MHHAISESVKRAFSHGGNIMRPHGAIGFGLTALIAFMGGAMNTSNQLIIVTSEVTTHHYKT